MPAPFRRCRRRAKGPTDDRDVRHAWHLELADLWRHPDGAGIDRARGVLVLARACGVAGRAIVVRHQSVLAAADPDVCDFCRRRGAAVAAHRTQQYLCEREQSVPQQARRCAGRPGVHAGKADRRRRRHGADRRHHLARRRARRAGRQPREDRAGRWRQSDGGGCLTLAALAGRIVGWARRSVPTILARRRTAGGGHGASAPLPTLRTRSYATPARSRSCRCTMPTGLLASVTISAVIFDELSSSTASPASVSRSMVLGLFVMTSSTSAVIRSGRMWRRRSPSVTMPTTWPLISMMPTQPKPFEVISTIASDILVPTGFG